MRFAAIFPSALTGVLLAAALAGNALAAEQTSGAMSAQVDDFSTAWTEKSGLREAEFSSGKTGVTMAGSTAEGAPDDGMAFTNLSAESTVLNGKSLAAQGASSSQELPQPAWLFAEERGTYFYSDNPVRYSATPAAGSSANTYLDLRVQWNQPADAATPRVLITTSQPDAAAMQRWIVAMQNRLTAPLQIMQADQRARIVYDRTSQTTGYLLLVASERLNSEGYLNGSNQSCAVVLKADAHQMRLSAGLPAAASNPTLRLKLFGYWQPAQDEKKIAVCQRRAGRTWIEFPVAAGASSNVALTKLPDPGIVEWMRRWLQ